MSQLAKAGVAAGVSQLRETDIGALAQLVRMLNIASGAGLMACAGLMTLWECTMDLWLCNPDDENSRCVDLGIELCGEGADAPACILASEEVLQCAQLCGLGLFDVLSTAIIAVFMFPLGFMILAFELTRTAPAHGARLILEKYFGFVFLCECRNDRLGPRLVPRL